MLSDVEKSENHSGLSPDGFDSPLGYLPSNRIKKVVLSVDRRPSLTAPSGDWTLTSTQ